MKLEKIETACVISEKTEPKNGNTESKTTFIQNKDKAIEFYKKRLEEIRAEFDNGDYFRGYPKNELVVLDGVDVMFAVLHEKEKKMAYVIRYAEQNEDGYTPLRIF
ncbi:MAG: hypothetical protein IKV81_01990 [Clostridia bacterium]|nr:hypothetical protein [Clostridia bacterium]